MSFPHVRDVLLVIYRQKRENHPSRSRLRLMHQLFALTDLFPNPIIYPHELSSFLTIYYAERSE